MRRDFALPGTAPRYAPDRTCDVQHVKLELDIDVAKHAIAGTCTLTVAAIRDQPDALTLDAVDLEIRGVTSADQTLPYEHDGRRLVIDIRSLNAAQGTPLSLAIEYAATPRRGLYFIEPTQAYPDKPNQVWSQGQDEDSRYWFPCFDAPHEKATSEVIATIPAQFTSLSNGSLIEDRIHGDRRTMHWRLDIPHSCYLITLVAGEFTVLRDTWRAPDGRDVALSCYVQPGREADAERSVQGLRDMLDLFSEQFGVYPYQSYAQVFVADFIFGGMENTTATTMSDILLVDERARADYPVDSIVAHELAHQWFGDLLTCRDWGQGWLNEGFATYSEYLWRERSEGRDAADVELDRWGRAYYEEDRTRYRRPVATRMYQVPLDIFDKHLYQKGGRILHMLRQILGDEAFFAAVAHYVDRHRFASVETRDLARAIEESSGRVLDWFFEQWVTDKAGHPELSISYKWDLVRELACITVTQNQGIDDLTPLFRLPCPVRFRIAESDRDVTLDITERQQTFYIDLPERPSHVIFDPGKSLLAQVTTEISTELVLHQLARATLAIDRAHAADILASRGGPRIAEALAEALASDPFWAVRAAAARGLGTVNSPAAREALIQAVSTTWHPRARRAIVRALGGFHECERAAATLAEILEKGDASYFVEAEACLALGRTRTESASQLLRACADRDSFMDVVRQHVYRGLAAARDDTAVPMLLEATAEGCSPHARAAAIGSLAELTAGRRDRGAKRARERAERLLRDDSFRVQYAAIEALRTIADPAALPALQQLVARELDGRLRRRAKEAMNDIRSGDGMAGQLEDMRQQLEAMRTRMHETLERMEQLEAMLSRRDEKRDKKRDRREKSKKHKKHKKHKKRKGAGKTGTQEPPVATG